MAKKEKTVSTKEEQEESSSTLYYEVEHLEMSGTFTNCNIFINAGSPSQPPPPPGGGK